MFVRIIVSNSVCHLIYFSFEAVDVSDSNILALISDCLIFRMTIARKFNIWFLISTYMMTTLLWDLESETFKVESLAAARKSAMSGSEPSDAVRVVNALLTQLDQIKKWVDRETQGRELNNYILGTSPS